MVHEPSVTFYPKLLLSRGRYMRIGRLKQVCMIVVAGLWSVTAQAADITVTDAWARASVGMGNGAVFLTVNNAGSNADRLIGASTPAAKIAQLHTHMEEGGVMRMRPIDGIDLPTGCHMQLKPGGMHVMLMGLTAPLKEGESFPLTLKFKEAEPMTVTVGGVSAMGMPMQQMPGSQMPPSQMPAQQMPMHHDGVGDGMKDGGSHP